MAKDNDLRWQKILWSVVIIFALTLAAYIRYSRYNNIISFWIYPYFIWPYVFIPSIIILILRFFRISIFQESFIYIFIGTLNFCIGVTGAYLIAKGDEKLSLLIHSMFYLNILLGSIIFMDVFKKRKLD